MSVPKYNEFMKPILEMLADGKEHSFKEILSNMKRHFKLSESDIQEMLPSNTQTVFYNRVAWADSYLKNAGLIESPARAIFHITHAGQAALKNCPNIIDVHFLEQFPAFSDFHKSKGKASKENADNENKTDAQTPTDKMESAFTEINESLASDLLDEVLKMDAYVFEKFVVKLLLQMGYGTLEYGSHVTQASVDDGIDGIIMEDRLGFNLIYMQAKKWAKGKTVGQPEIQSFVGAIAGKQGHGLFVTTADFSSNAKKYADEHHIILIDGKRLANLMIESNFCVSVKKSYDVKAIDTDALDEYLDS